MKFIHRVPLSRLILLSCRPGRSAPSTSVLMKRGVWARDRWRTFCCRIFSYSSIFLSLIFTFLRVQVEEYKKKYGPNGEFINNIWCQCWWSDESHTCLPHLFSQTWCHWKGKQGDISRLRQFQAWETFSGWHKVRQHAILTEKHFEAESKSLVLGEWKRVDLEEGSMQRQSLQAGERSKSFPCWRPGW